LAASFIDWSPEERKMKILDKIENAFIALTIFAATILVTLNVVMRWMGLGTSWSEELTRYLLISMTFIGISVCARNNEHIGIDLLPLLSKGKVKILVHAVIYVVCLIFSALFTWYGIELVQFIHGTSQEMPSLGAPMYLIYLTMPIGGLLMTVRYVQNLITLFRNPNSVLTETRKEHAAV
jgi:C4-dicarboxylate transporter DctQ subunit